MDGSEIIGGEPIISRSDTTKVLQAAEHALDGIAVAIEERRKAVRPLAVSLGRNVRHGAAALHLTADRITIVAFVAVQDLAGRHLCQQALACRAVGDIGAGQQEFQRSAVRIGQRVDFGGASAARTTDGLIALPPLPPEAERWALTAEESISTSADSPSAFASAWNRSAQTPLAAQRT